MSDGKRPLGFVNRRGHAASDVSAKELEALSIDEQPSTAIDIPETVHSEPTSTEKKSKKQPKNTKSGTKPPKKRRRLRWSKRKTLIASIIVIAVVAIPIVIGELLRVQYLASTSNAESSLKTIITHDVLPMQKQSDITSKQVSAVTGKLETVRDDMCPGGLLDNMAALYPRANSAHQTCIAERGKIASLSTQMRDMTAMLAYIEALNAALAPVNTPTTDDYAVIANQQTSWQQASDNIQKISAPNSMKVAHDQLVVAVKSITEGWSKLNIANNAQNATDFNAAEQQLTDGYAAVRASKDSFAQTIAAKQSTITQSANSLN